MKPIVKNLTINAKSYFKIILRCKDKAGTPIPQSSYTFKASVKKDYNSTEPLAEFECTPDSEGVVGDIALEMSSEESTKLNAFNSAHWDIIRIRPSDNEAERFMQGEITISKGVTP